MKYKKKHLKLDFRPRFLSNLNYVKGVKNFFANQKSVESSSETWDKTTKTNRHVMCKADCDMFQFIFRE